MASTGLIITKRALRQICSKGQIDRKKGIESLIIHLGSGRKRCTSERTERQLVSLVRRNPRITRAEITNELNQRGITSPSFTTITRRLMANGLNYRRARRKPLLTVSNKKQRLDWAKKHIHLTEREWSKVLFTDECAFRIAGSQRDYVRRRVGQELLPQMVVQTLPFGGGKISVWGCVSECGIFKFKIYDGVYLMYIQNINRNDERKQISKDIAQILPKASKQKIQSWAWTTISTRRGHLPHYKEKYKFNCRACSSSPASTQKSRLKHNRTRVDLYEATYTWKALAAFRNS